MTNFPSKSLLLRKSLRPKARRLNTLQYIHHGLFFPPIACPVRLFLHPLQLTPSLLWLLKYIVSLLKMINRGHEVFYLDKCLKVLHSSGTLRSVYRTLPNVPEERRSHLLLGGSLKSCKVLYFQIYIYIYIYFWCLYDRAS